MKTKLKKAAMWSDTHFGAKGNSTLHNDDCLDFAKFLVEEVKKDKEIDHLVFMGDWFDHRNAINISTLNYSYKAVSLINTLGLPVYFLVGNHDLYQRHTRDVHSLPYINEFENFHLIDKPEWVENGDVKILMLPFIFEEEYTTLLSEINKSDVIYGHLELKGFVLTGTHNVLEHGPDHTLFLNPKKIFTGHFHKRQNKDNVHYIGNAYPLNYSDANDVERGFATYEYATDEVVFHDWLAAPTYIKCKLSDLLENHKTMLRAKASVKCLDDEHITIEESIKIREKFIKKYELREFFLEEETNSVISDEDISLDGFELESTDVIVKELLKTKIDSDTLDSDKLVKIYEQVRAKR